MPGRIDTLEQHESLTGSFALSAILHAGMFVLVAVYTYAGGRSGPQWGDPRSLGGSSVGITAVQQIPLPARSGALNPLANDTESRVPSPPKPEPKAAPTPAPEAIPLRGHEKPRKPTYMRSQQAQTYRTRPDRPNQLYSNSGQALSSNMFGAQTGTGGVGMNPGGAFGARFGWYRDLLEQRVAQKWRTDDVDPRLQTAPPVIVTFEIQKNGSISGVRLLQGSGNRALDYSAQRAIYEAAPFPPLPEGYEHSSAGIEFWFTLKR
jgi:protein TonB